MLTLSHTLAQHIRTLADAPVSERPIPLSHSAIAGMPLFAAHIADSHAVPALIQHLPAGGVLITVERRGKQTLLRAWRPIPPEVESLPVSLGARTLNAMPNIPTRTERLAISVALLVSMAALLVLALILLPAAPPLPSS